MENPRLVHLLIFGVFAVWSFAIVNAEDPYLFFTWEVTYGTADTLAPPAKPSKVILINGQFPGPPINCVTNDNLIINVINKLDEPFLLTWNGIKQRKNCWQDGVLGTNCPIPPNANYTYALQAKDQVGTYSYFPSIGLQRSMGGYGSINVNNRDVIAIPYQKPDFDYSMLIGDWYLSDSKTLSGILDSGKFLPMPDGLLINGLQVQNKPFNASPGKTYRFRVANVGMKTSINFFIEGHKMKIVEIEGSHVQQNLYDNIDLHPGQGVGVLVTCDQPPLDYNIVASTRFTEKTLVANAILHYENAPAKQQTAPPPIPVFTPTYSIEQARSFRWNLTANAARPNPQGSFHYGQVNISTKYILQTSAPIIDGKQRCAVNGISYINPDTPLKLSDHFKIPDVFDPKTFSPSPIPAGPPKIATAVIQANFHDFIEIIFQNTEDIMQTWHLDGYDFWVVGFGEGTWTESTRSTYNLVDAFTRYTTQVYPKGWTAILMSLDNKGMWNFRSADWERRYLGQELYMNVWSDEASLTTEYNIPANALMCGKAADRKPT